jgi:hypothetical protein
MADFNVNVDDLGNSQSITAMVKRSFYPENQQIVKNTSYSQDDNYDRTLMTRDVVKVMQGDGIYRNPAFPLAGYENNTKAALHTVLAMGSDIDETVAVADPDDPKNEARLTGAQARLEIARKSIMTTGFAPGGFDQAVESFVSSATSDVLNGQLSSSETGGTERRSCL